MSRTSTTRPTTLVTFRYLARFSCLGGDCADSCCEAGWRIDVDEGHYRRVRRALGAALADAVMTRNQGEGRSPQRFGLTVLDARGACSLLDDDRLCSLHRRFGEELLPDACALYPRVVSRVGARFEQTALLSCPETARLALLDEQALELDEVSPSRAPRFDGRELVAVDPADPYDRCFDDVRGAAQALLSSPRYPVASRLAFVAALAHQLTPFLHRGTSRFDEERYAAAMQAIARDEAQARLHRNFHATRDGERFAAEAVLELLASRLDAGVAPAFLGVARAAFADCAAESGRAVQLDAADETSAAQTIRVTPESLLAVHARRRAALAPTLAARMERYFENYARHFWFRDWYLHAPNLTRHAQALALRVAVARFLLLGQPAANAGEGTPDAARHLDEAAVTVFYSFTRALDHHGDFMDRVMAALDEKSLVSLAHTLALLRF